MYVRMFNIFMRNGPYTLIKAPANYPGKKYRGRYAYEHLVEFWKHWGFVPKKGWEIHHVNGNHRDNVLANLQLVTAQEHRKLHGELNKKKHRRKILCGFCYKELIIKGNHYRFKMKINKYGKIFCSRRCGIKHHFSEVAGRS